LRGKSTLGFFSLSLEFTNGTSVSLDVDLGLFLPELRKVLDDIVIKIFTT
jgi:hypothetical protein